MQKREDFGSDTRARDNSKNQIVKWISDNNGNRKKNVTFERKRDAEYVKKKGSNSAIFHKKEEATETLNQLPNQPYKDYFEDLLEDSGKESKPSDIDARGYDELESTKMNHENGSVRTKNIESKQQEDYKISEDTEKSTIEEQKRQRDEWRLKRIQQERKALEKLYREKKPERRKSEDGFVNRKSGSQKEQKWREKGEANSNSSAHTQVKRIERRPSNRSENYNNSEQNSYRPIDGKPSEFSPISNPHLSNQSNNDSNNSKSAKMYSLWKSNQTSAFKEGEKEEETKNASSNQKFESYLGKPPSLKDLNEAVFNPSNEFEEGEIVLAPRTRGGFSYSKVIKKMSKNHCFFDPVMEHKTIVWRVVYQNGGKTLYKDLPAPYVGKLKTGAPTLGTETVEGEVQIERILGSRPSLKDLQNIIFSPQCSFTENEIVLIPRSSGGFTYGRLNKETIQSCKLAFEPGEAHHLVAWKVIVSEESPNSVTRKELCSGCIGKIQLFTSNATAAEVNIRKVLTIQGTQVDPNLFKKESELIAEARAEGRKNKSNNRRDGRRNKNRRRNKQDDRTNSREQENKQKRLEAVEDKGEEEYPVWTDESDSENESDASSQDTINEEIQPLTQSESVPSLPPTNSNPVHSASPRKQITESNKTNAPAPPVNANANINPSSNQNQQQIGGLLAVDKKELLKQLLVERKFSRTNKHAIVIDGPNVAMRHGKENEYSSEGIKIALDYWNNKGHDAICFLPQHYIKRKPQTGPATLMEYLPRVNNIPLIMQLVDQGRVVLTPPQDYDDSYCIEYAMQHNSCIVTNDRYNDHVDKLALRTDSNKNDTKKWLREHCISYTFVRDEFMPNPNFEFPPL